MNIKIASRLIYILYVIALVLVLTTLHAGHFTRSIIFSVFIALSCIYMIIRLIAIRKKAAAGGDIQVSGIQKVLNNILVASAFGVMFALILIVWHMRYIGFPLLNVSLVICILGFCGLLVISILSLCGLMIVPQRPNAPLNPNQSMVAGALLILCVICTLIGMLLRINHYPGGKQLTFYGLASAIITSVIIIIYAGYIKKKRSW